MVSARVALFSSTGAVCLTEVQPCVDEITGIPAEIQCTTASSTCTLGTCDLNCYKYKMLCFNMENRCFSLSLNCPISYFCPTAGQCSPPSIDPGVNANPEGLALSRGWFSWSLR